MNSKHVVFVILIFLMLAFFVPVVQAENSQGKVALIAASSSIVEEMRLMDIRRLFLGFKSVDSTSVKNPVLNIQSKNLYDDFMKNIMHMTEGSYKRKIIKGIFRQGRKEIKEVTSLEELNNHLLKNTGDVSFATVSSLEKMENIKVIQILW